MSNTHIARRERSGKRPERVGRQSFLNPSALLSRQKIARTDQMENHLVARISDALLAASKEVTNASSSHELKQSLVGTIQYLEEVVSRMHSQHLVEGACSEEHALHERALEDYDQIQRHLSAVATTLADQDRFVWMLRNRGSDREAYRAHAGIIGSLDRVMGGVVHLMHFDTSKRVEVDTRQGFMFTCGSVNYGRTHF